MLGGWATYLVVNRNFKAAHGRDYHGSKDIDLGFHIDENSTPELLKNSTFNKAIQFLEKDGFYLVGSRLVQHYHKDTRRPLTEEESKKVAIYNMFNLYVDPIVDRTISEIKKVLGIDPIDEPLLQQVFEHKKYHVIDYFGAKLLLPNTEVLLATKFNSVLKRQKDHKRTKDVADIFALIWYSGMKSRTLETALTKITKQAEIAEIISKLSDNDYEEAAKALGVTAEEVSTVIKSFIPLQTSSIIMSEEQTPDNRWRIPFNLSYDGYIKIIRALYHQKADSASIPIARLLSVTQMNKNTLSLNLTFLRAAGIIDRDDVGYKLTNLGAEYSKAHYQNNREAIKSTSKKMIENSHLRSLKDYIELNPSVELRQLYDFIRAEGRYAEASSPTGITVPWGQGAKVLLNICKDAGILPPDFAIDIKPVASDRSQKPKTPVKQNRAKQLQGKFTGEKSVKETDTELESLGRLSIKGVGTFDISDEDTMRLAESALEILKKKIKETRAETEVDAEPSS